MKALPITRCLKVPTGEILVVEGTSGLLEVVSLGDYGKEVNLTRQAVPDGMPLLPLTEKWVVTISTQYGCSIGCKFCDVPKVGPGRSVSCRDLMGQVLAALNLPGKPRHTNRLNVHFARMGEPTLNVDVLECARQLHQLPGYNVHPVVSTMMPRWNRYLKPFLQTWVREIKNDLYQGNAGLQLSINSTDPMERDYIFNGQAADLELVAQLMAGLKPKGRKITLNFAVADYIIDCDRLANLFSPEHYIVKLTPMHKTVTAQSYAFKTSGDYTSPEPYLELEERFKRVGFDTLVFIASREEDENLITCGNAVLSGSLPLTFTEQT